MESVSSHLMFLLSAIVMTLLTIAHMPAGKDQPSEQRIRTICIVFVGILSCALVVIMIWPR